MFAYITRRQLNYLMKLASEKTDLVGEISSRIFFFTVEIIDLGTIGVKKNAQ